MRRPISDTHWYGPRNLKNLQFTHLVLYFKIGWGKLCDVLSINQLDTSYGSYKRQTRASRIQPVFISSSHLKKKSIMPALNASPYMALAGGFISVASLSVALSAPLVRVAGLYDLHLFPRNDVIDYDVSRTHLVSQIFHILALGLFLVPLCCSLQHRVWQIPNGLCIETWSISLPR